MSLLSRNPSLTGARRIAPRRIYGVSAVLLSTLLLSGCVTYEDAPLDPSALLTDLRAVTLPIALDATPPTWVERPVAIGPHGEPSVFDPSDGLSVQECVAVAIQLSPDLSATRARLGVAQAQLVLSGVLPDPTVGWDFNEGNVQFLLPLLRPDERDAREAGAEAILAETRWEILQAEWELGRRVHLAILDLLGARERVRLNEELSGVVRESLDFFTRAHALAAATALDVETASIQEARVRADGARLASEVRRAALALNNLMGLPPGVAVPLEQGLDLSHGWPSDPAPAEAVVDLALEARPDLQALIATYAQAEAALRLAVARQWPQLGIGTTVQLTIGLLSDFNEPAIDVAFARREQVGRQLGAVIHALRAEVHGAFEAVNQARAELDVLAGELAPRLDESLRLLKLAVQAGQVTAAEILVAQGQVIEARVRSLEVEIEVARRAAVARWVVGVVQEDGR